MEKQQILSRSIREHQRAMQAGEYTAYELTQMFLKQIEEKEPTVGAYLTVDPEGALEAAKASDARRAKGTLLCELDGIPYAVKDNFCTAGMRTTCASRMLEHYIPPYDATVISRLRECGAVLLGKLNLDEFAMGSSTEHSALGVTLNPHDLTRVPGGSSGGSAAAVAANEAVFTLGTDTGGSVRQPASFCGVLGLKPTYGSISRAGVIAMASSMDAVGVLTRCAEDCGSVFSVLAGKDPMDATTLDYQPLPTVEGRPLRVAVVEDFFRPGMISPEVRRGLEHALDMLAANGAQTEYVSLPAPELALSAYSVLASAEASSNMARFDGVHYGERRDGENLRELYSNTRAYGLGQEVKRRILFGAYVLTDDRRQYFYHRALQVREDVFQAMKQTLAEYDLVLSPATPSVAFGRNARLAPEEMYRADLCTVYANLSGLPALTVPVGKSEEGLPVTVQFTAGACGEARLFEIARKLEEYCDEKGI